MTILPKSPTHPVAQPAIDVRPYDPADRHGLRTIFDLVGASHAGGQLWGHPESEAAVFLYPYLELEPRSVLVAEVEGEVVGYLAGSRGEGLVPPEGTRMETAIRAYSLYRKPAPLRFFARALWDTAVAAARHIPLAADFSDPRYPAHLHINVLESSHGKGVGSALVTAWLETLQQSGCRGCHVGTLLQNERALRFFQRHGFRQVGSPNLVPGVRHHGQPVHQVLLGQEFSSIGRP